MSRKQLFTFTGVFIKDLSSSAGRSELACATTLLNIPFMKRIRAHLLSLVADTATLVFVKLNIKTRSNQHCSNNKQSLYMPTSLDLRIQLFSLMVAFSQSQSSIFTIVLPVRLTELELNKDNIWKEETSIVAVNCANTHLPLRFAELFPVTSPERSPDLDELFLRKHDSKLYLYNLI